MFYKNFLFGLLTINSCLWAQQSTPVPKEKVQIKTPEETKEQERKAQIEQIQGEMAQKTPKSLALSFSQTAYKNLRGKTITTRGEAFFQKPNQFRWILFSENSQTKKEIEEWRYNGHNLWHYFPNQKEAQSFQQTNKAKDINDLVDMIFNFETLKKNYTFHEVSKETPSQTKMDLLPISPNADITKVELTYDHKEFYIRKIKLFMKGDNWTQFEFEKKNITQGFDFSIPQGVKVTAGF